MYLTIPWMEDVLLLLFYIFPASLLLPVFVKVFLHFEIKKQVGDC